MKEMQSKIQRNMWPGIIPTLSYKAITMAAPPFPTETSKTEELPHRSCFSAGEAGKILPSGHF